ncbi:hypothetical protein BCR34DRAFT_583262 [Clohesyomyces aquaticus]|uniref:Uncharacterized protein n=1 Tax=Clohesyomyces aquaticus TaxID=1231657 RepID=A0A1Y2A662_9PLEO|nr:hypothetical protein BCR34DRAFT_583262 [Clohesyomyces aquaticus]
MSTGAGCLTAVHAILEWGMSRAYRGPHEGVLRYSSSDDVRTRDARVTGWSASVAEWRRGREQQSMRRRCGGEKGAAGAVRCEWGWGECGREEERAQNIGQRAERQQAQAVDSGRAKRG